MAATPDEITTSLSQADDFHNKGDHKHAYSLLKSINRRYDPEILWRLARASYYMHAEEKTDQSSLEQAQDYADLAVLLDPTHKNACKWAAVLFREPPTTSPVYLDQLDYYTTVAMQHADITAFDLFKFGKRYVMLRASYASAREKSIRLPDSSDELGELMDRAERRAVTMHTAAETVGGIDPDSKLKIAIFAQKISNDPTKAAEIYREIIKEHGQCEDPDVKSVVEEALVHLREVHLKSFEFFH